MTRSQPPGRRSAAGGVPRRPRPDDSLPGVQFPVVEDLSRITADDEFLDAIAAGGTDLRSVVSAGVPGRLVAIDGSAAGRRPAGLGPLLVAWRTELLEPPLPALPTLAPRPMLAPADRSRRRSMRSLLSVGAAICALLMASTAVGAHSAQPGEPLWGLSQVLWSDHANSIEAKVSAQRLLEVAGKAVASHDRTQALIALDQADAAMKHVSTDDGLGDLQRNYSALRQQAEQLPPGPAVAALVEPADTSAGGGASAGSSGGGLIPPVTTSSSKRSTAPTASSALQPKGAVAASVVGGAGVAAGAGAGAVGAPPQSVTDLPIVPLPASTSPVVPTNAVAPADPGVQGNPVLPANPGTAPGATSPGSTVPGATLPATTVPATTVGPITTAPATTEPGTTAPSTTDGSTAPVEATTPPVTTSEPAPDTTADPADPSPGSSTDAPSTDVPPTDDPSTSSADPSTSSTDPTTDASTPVSTTSAIPTTLDSSTPSTDADGSTVTPTSTTTTQTAPVNSTDGTGTTENDPAGDPGTDTTATADAGDPTTTTEQSGP